LTDRIFVVTQLEHQTADQYYRTKLQAAARRVRRQLKASAKALLDNEKAKNYSEVAQELISSHSVMGCSMSMKLHFLLSHTDFSPQNTEPLQKVPSGHLPNGKGAECKMESKHVADYCWRLTGVTPTGEYETKGDMTECLFCTQDTVFTDTVH
jgi:hypothetical protein